MSARFDNVMFASLQPSDFLRSVCLHCREMSSVHMHPLKAAGLSFNFGNMIQVVMSVSRCMFNIMSDLWWFDSIFLSPACFPPGISDGRKIIDLIEKCLSWLAKFYKEIPFPHYLLYGVIQVSEWNFD